MKSLVTVLSVLLFVSIVYAQNSPPAPAGSLHHDTMQLGKNAPDGDVGPMSMCPQGKRLFPGHGMNFRPGMMQPGCDGKGSAEMGMENCHQWGPRFMHRPPCCSFLMPLLFKLLFLGFILYAALNILLTIIVSLDMARNGRFNGLWIPILLIAGIPGSVIYALFRIGDRLPCKGT
jgi:hypothetical protein